MNNKIITKKTIFFCIIYFSTFFTGNALESSKILKTNNDNEIRKYFLANPSKINEQNQFGQTPIMDVVANQRPYSVFEAILAFKPNVTIKDTGGSSPIHIAARQCNISFVKKLYIELKKDNESIDVIDKFGFTPLLRAINEDCKDVVLFLLQNRANIEITNNKGEGVLDIAARHGTDSYVYKIVDKYYTIALKTSNQTSEPQQNNTKKEPIVVTASDINESKKNYNTPVNPPLQRANNTLIKNQIRSNSANSAKYNTSKPPKNYTKEDSAILLKSFMSK